MNCKRYFVVFATMLLVLLSSCPVKTSIKTLVGGAAKTERNLPKPNRNFLSSAIDKCAEFEVADTQIAQKFSFKANNLLPVVLFTASFLFLFSLLPLIKENKHPIYNGSSKIRSSIPIFLEYQKLIIHFV